MKTQSKQTVKTSIPQKQKLVAIDIGNTHIKCACGSRRLVVPTNSAEAALRLALQAFCNPIAHCTVCISSVNTKVSRRIERILKVAVFVDLEQLLKSPANPITKVLSTGTGIDRILGTISALSICEAPLITIDCGTATTINLLNKKKEFCGGLIMPGIQTQLDSLHTATAALPRVHSKGSHPVLGRTTESAIRSGVIRGSVGAIVHCVREMQQTKDGKNAKVVLSGGNARYIQKELSASLELLQVNDLVLRGILHLLERNNKDVYGSHSPTRRSGGSAA